MEIISLLEGGTPLIPLNRLGKIIGGLKKLYMKFEGTNPTGSSEDRGMTVAVSIAKYLGVKVVVCASTGNTSSSMSAYARRAGLVPIVVLPKGKVARGMLSQSKLYGAITIFTGGNFDDALNAIIEASKEGIVYSLNSINPWRIEGQKTVGFEIVDEIGVPDWIALSVGNAGNISALWKGLLELKRFGLIHKLPRLLVVQAERAAPIVETFRRNAKELIFIENPETVASAISVGRPVHWERALKALRESKGCAIAVSDEEILEAQKLIAKFEGIGVEPASAAPIAGIIRAIEDKIIDRNETVVVIATSHALKDPETASIHIHFSYYASNTREVIKLLKKIAVHVTR